MPLSPESASSIPRRSWWIAALIFVLSLLAYAGFSGERVMQASAHNHFVYLADSYLHGTTKMRVDPPHQNDWASYERLTLASGQELIGTWLPLHARRFRTLDSQHYEIERAEYSGRNDDIPPRCRDDLPAPGEREQPEDRRCSERYVSFPPGPAVLMLPGVALFGMRFNDVLFTLLFAAGSAASLFLLLDRTRRESKVSLRESDVYWLTAFFAFGTCAAWCSVFGEVWFTAMVVGTFFSIWFVYFSLDLRAPFWAGLMLGCAFAARTPYVFAAIFMAWMMFFPGGTRRRWDRTLLRDVLLFGAAPTVIGLLLMAQNYVRFGSMSEFGHTYLSHGQNLLIAQYGLFNVYFASLNLGAMLAALPQFLPHEPYIVVSRHGLALWFSMPAMLWAVWPRPSAMLEAPFDAHARSLRIACGLAITVIAVTHIFYHNTGWIQFSYRFAMDYLVFLVLLIAFSGHRLGWLFRSAVLLSIGINVFGAVTFGRFGGHYAGWFFEALQTAP